MKSFYVVVNAQNQYARAGSTVSQIQYTDKLDEALIWEAPQFASLFANNFGAQVRVRPVEREDMDRMVEPGFEHPSWYLGFREIGLAEYQPIHQFPESDASIAACLTNTFESVAAALFARQILSRKYGHSYQFQYAHQPFQYHRRQRQRA